MQEGLSHLARKLVTVVDPHMKTDPNYRHYQECRDKGILVKNKDGKDYEGWCWPG